MTMPLERMAYFAIGIEALILVTEIIGGYGLQWQIGFRWPIFMESPVAVMSPPGRFLS
jgi:hypothetical protein